MSNNEVEAKQEVIQTSDKYKSFSLWIYIDCTSEMIYKKI